jgi:hypothetical protein
LPNFTLKALGGRPCSSRAGGARFLERPEGDATLLDAVDASSPSGISMAFFALAERALLLPRPGPGCQPGDRNSARSAKRRGLQDSSPPCWSIVESRLAMPPR